MNANELQNLEEIATALRVRIISTSTIENTGGGCFVLYVGVSETMKIGVDAESVVGYVLGDDEWTSPIVKPIASFTDQEQVIQLVIDTHRELTQSK